MKSTKMKPYSCLIASDFPYCPLPASPWPTQSASPHDAKSAGPGHPSGKRLAAGRNGRKSIVTVLIGVRESMNDTTMANLLLSLPGNSGINSARQSRTKHLLLIEYDPSLARRRDILAHLGDRGLHACVAGC